MAGIGAELLFPDFRFGNVLAKVTDTGAFENFVQNRAFAAADVK